jgi:hypothetical protein
VVQDSLGINCLQAAANQFNTGDQAAAAESGDVIGDTNTAGGASNLANWFGLGTAQVNVVGTNSSSGGSAQSPLGVGSTGALNLLSADAPVDPVVPSALGALALAGMGMLLLRRKGGSYS